MNLLKYVEKHINFSIIIAPLLEWPSVKQEILMQTRSIDIDLEVFRFLESKRSSFEQSHNDILRELAGFSGGSRASSSAQAEIGRAWVWKGVTLPHNTKLRMSYNGRMHTGEVLDGVWHVEGETFRAPSAASSGVARTKQGNSVSLDGWEYWEVQFPGTTRWKRLNDLRSKKAR